MIDVDAFVEHLNRPDAVIEHAIHVEENHFVHLLPAFRCRVNILWHK